MLSETVLGKVNDTRFQDKKIDYISISWDEAFKKIHIKTTEMGREIGIHLENWVLQKGLRQDDVLWEDSESVIAVNMKKTKAICITVEADHPRMAAKVCYEIGNRHATLFWGADDKTFITPYTIPLYDYLKKLHGISLAVSEMQFDFDKRISASVNAHSH